VNPEHRIRGGLTVREAQHAATRRLAQSPELRDRAAQDAALLLRHTLGLSPAQLLAYPERVLSAKQGQRFQQALTRRLAHEPIQYILGEQEFYGLALRVTPAVLIPRPETELLVQAVLSDLSQNAGRRGDRLQIVDVGTGSGAIAIALGIHLPEAELTAVDISPESLAVAQENVHRHGLEAQIRLLPSDLLAGLPSGEQAFDVIVSNPPYVPLSDRSTLHPEVREYEPATALFAGDSGLDIYRHLIPQARLHLRSGGLLAMEFGYGQRDALSHLLVGWNDVRFLPDLQGIPRAVLARS
jgi:release factor glutamine methyltransferase